MRDAEISSQSNRAPAGGKSLLGAALAIAVVSLSFGLGTALAQDNQEPPPQGPAPGMGEHMGRHPMPSVDDQLKHLTRKLSLSDDQQAKLKPILEDQRKQMEQIHNDSSLSRQDRFSKMRDLHSSTDSQIKAVLNEDQQKKFDQMREEQHRHMRGNRGGPSGQHPEGDQPPPGGNPDKPQ